MLKPVRLLKYSKLSVSFSGGVSRIYTQPARPIFQKALCVSEAKGCDREGVPECRIRFCFPSYLLLLLFCFGFSLIFCLFAYQIYKCCRTYATAYTEYYSAENVRRIVYIKVHSRKCDQRRIDICDNAEPFVKQIYCRSHSKAGRRVA